MFNNKKALVIYFSRADENYFGGSMRFIEKGNTEVIAEYIKEIIGADLFKVEPLVPYSDNYMTCINEAKERTSSHNAPIKKEVPDISSYEVIYIGSPIYWGGMPEEMFTALRELDFSGKTIRVFVTHEGSGLSGVPRQVKELCRDANVLDDAIAIQGSSVNSAKSIIENWL